MLDILENLDSIFFVIVVVVLLFIALINFALDIIINYSGFFSSSEVRKRFYKNLKKSILENFTTKRERTFSILFFTALIVACMWFVFYVS